MSTHSSSLARKIPWTEEPDGLQSVGWQRVRHGRETERSTALPEGMVVGEGGRERFTRTDTHTHTHTLVYVSSELVSQSCPTL